VTAPAILTKRCWWGIPRYGHHTNRGGGRESKQYNSSGTKPLTWFKNFSKLNPSPSLFHLSKISDRAREINRNSKLLSFKMHSNRNRESRSKRNHPAYRFDRADELPYPSSTRDERYMDGFGYVTLETRAPRGESSGGGGGGFAGGFEREHEHFPSTAMGGGSFRDRDAGLYSSPSPRRGGGGGGRAPSPPYYSDDLSDDEDVKSESPFPPPRRRREPGIVTRNGFRGPRRRTLVGQVFRELFSSVGRRSHDRDVSPPPPPPKRRRQNTFIRRQEPESDSDEFDNFDTGRSRGGGGKGPDKLWRRRKRRRLGRF
jgi:hypothetical protein